MIPFGSAVVTPFGTNKSTYDPDTPTLGILAEFTDLKHPSPKTSRKYKTLPVVVSLVGLDYLPLELLKTINPLPYWLISFAPMSKSYILLTSNPGF